MFSFIKTFITNKLITINTYIHNKYSWNLLSIFGLCELIFFIAMNFVYCPGCGTPFVLVLFYVYPITFKIFLILFVIENLAKISIKNETFVNSKKYKILRYIGLATWFYPIIGLLI